MSEFAVLRVMTGNELRRWYHEELSEAFPLQERKPLGDILSLREADRYDALGLFLEERLLGYAAVWREADGRCALLDYLGVSAPLRGQGLGGEILRRLTALYPARRIITEAELPVRNGDSAENRLRERRIGFYMRNGFTPAYRMGACGLKWQVLLSGTAPDSGELERIMTEHSALYASAARADVRIPLPANFEPVMPYWLPASENDKK